MKKMFVIQWQSTVNGRAGRGTKQFERDEAERLAQELNQEYPQIRHEIVEIDSTPREPTPRESEVPQSSEPASLLSVFG